MPALRACVAALALLVLGTGSAAADHGYWPDGGVEPARVTGHRVRTEASAVAAEWGADCGTRPSSRRGRSVDVYGNVLDARYRLVVVLAEVEGTGEPLTGPNGVTIFRNARAGQFVWADADGDSRFAGRHEADAGAMIFCGASALPATDTVVVETPPSPTLLGIGLMLGLVSILGTVVSNGRRAASAVRSRSSGA
ncbi:MAG: hypothetical protein ACSLFN_00195 [Candidatus Limnocylindrales bacterium]